MWQFKKKNSKTEILRYMKVISKFLPCGAFNFNFYKKNIHPPPPPPPPKKKKKKKRFPSGKSFLKQMLFHSLSEVSIRFGVTVFS